MKEYLKWNKWVLYSFIFLLSQTTINAQSTNSKYDKHLADSMGADDYGMKMYVLVILKTGPVKIEEKQNPKKMIFTRQHEAKQA